MQYNVIPLAQARNMGVIGIKVFADGAMYTKEPFSYSIQSGKEFKIVAVDAIGRKSATEVFTV